MSSTIWKSTPSSSPNARQGASLLCRETARRPSRVVTPALQEPPGLQACSRREPVAVQLAVHGHVEVLAADHPERRVGQLARRLGRRVARATSRNASASSASPARIATSSPKRTWDARLAAAQVVVVERRQVVVDEAEGVHELERAPGRQELGRVAPERLAGREAEHRPDPLAAAEQRVAQRLLEPPELVRRRAARRGSSSTSSRSSSRPMHRPPRARAARPPPAPPSPARRAPARTSTARSGSSVASSSALAASTFSSSS